MELTIATWNLWWAHGQSPRGVEIARVLVALDADILVVTEAEADVLPRSGHVVDAGSDWGYQVRREGRRKVLMWSAAPWSDIDSTGSAALPGGRWVAATTKTALGPVRVVGVCIPWSGAHVTTGRRDRRRWQDHASYLDGMTTLVASQPRPLIVTGDFNQRIPAAGQPKPIAEALTTALGNLTVATAGETGHGSLIDHVAHSPELASRMTQVLPDRNEYRRLSDHFGAVVAVSR